MVRITPIQLIAFALVLFLSLSNTANGQCSTDGSVEILDLQPVSANLVVDGAINNDLTGTQGVCGIALNFEHNQVGDVTIQLTSPDGQTVTLLGPTGSFGNTAFTNWDVLFVPCAQAPNPDSGFLDKWNNNQNWGLLGDYSGSYHPYLGCLEDFNVGSVNGIWSIQILDNTLFDQGQLISATIFFCEQEGLSCVECEAYAGEFTESEFNYCTSNATNVEPSVEFPEGEPNSGYEYYYVLHQGDEIFEISQFLDLSSYVSGQYEVCGFSISTADASQIASLASMTFADFTIEVEGPNPSICGDLSEECSIVNLSNAPQVVDLNITICDGDSYVLGGTSFSIPDTYQVVIENTNSCDSTYNLNLSTVDIQALATGANTLLTCAEPELQISGSSSNFSNTSNFYWTSSGGGIIGANDQETITINQAATYTFTIVDGLCVSTSSIQISASEDTPDIALTGGTITCSSPEVFIDLESSSTLTNISWTGPNGYMANTEDITVTEPGIYSVIVLSDNGCQGSKSILINDAGENPVLQLTANDISCSLPQVIIQVQANSNSLTYEWTGPNGFESNVKNPLVSESGIYTVTATDPFGCADEFIIEIFGDANILDYDLIYTDLNCPTSNTNLILTINDVNAIVEWVTPNGTSLYGPSVLSNQIGNYTVSILSNGCNASDVFTINEDYGDLPTVQITQSNLVSCGEPTAVLSGEILTNLEFVDHVEWVLAGFGSVGTDFQVEANLGGQYAFFVYTLDGCRLRFNHTIEFGTGLPSAVLSSDNITCSNSDGAIYSISAQELDYSWTGPSGFTSQDSFDLDVDAGSYFLTVTDNVGCTREFYVNVLTDTIPAELGLITSGELNCINDSISISPLTLILTDINWTSDNGFTSTDAIIKVDEPGSYFMVAEGAFNGCISYDTIEVTKDISDPDIQTEDQVVNCSETFILLQAESTTIGASYSWIGPSGFVSTFKNPLISDPGLYTLEVTGPNGCTISKTINVSSDNTLPDVSASFSNDLDCVDIQSDIIGSSITNDVTFMWQGPGSFVSDQPVVTVENAGEYTFFVTGPNGCTDSTSFILPFTGEYPEFNALGDTLFCGESDNFIDIDEVTANVSYSWQGPNGYISGDGANMVQDSGMYILTGTAVNSCVSVDTAFVIFDNQSATISISDYDTLDCILVMQELIIEADKQFANISWTGPNGFDENTQIVSITEGGTYTFTGVSENNCEAILEIEVTQDIALPTFTIEAEEINCDNNKADITLDNSDSGATYNWSGTNYSSDLQNPVVENEGDYFVTVTGSNGCENTDMIFVNASLEDPEVVVKNDTLPCDGVGIELFLETTTADVTFQWIGPNGFTSDIQNPLATLAGTYFVEVIATNGCSVNEIIELDDIPIYPKFDIKKSNDITCETRFTTMTAIDVEDDESFEWTGPNGFASTENSFSTDESGTYYISVVGITGCIELDSIVVALDTLYPIIEIKQAGKLLCDINDPKINGLGSSIGIEYKYQWSTEDGEILFGNNTLEPKINGKGTYKLYVIDESNGCGFSRELEIKEEESTLESVDLDYILGTCSYSSDGIIEIVAVEGGEAPYRFATEGTSYTQNTVFSDLDAGTYLISVKDSFGCILDTLVNLEAKKEIDVDLGDDLNISLGEIVNLQALTNFPTNQISTIQWTPNEIIDCLYCLDFEFMPGQNTQVTITLEDEDGCITSDQLIIRVDEGVNLYVPNIFSPNGDGVNDTWYISESKNIELINYFNIYDRWGTKVFGDEKFIPGQGLTWDGRHRGQAVMQGVYVYIAEVTLVNGKSKIIKGNVTIAR